MKVAVIGCGNMSSALVEGFYSHYKNHDFYLYTPSKTRARDLSSRVSGHFVENLEDFKELEIDYWLLGMKPQGLSDFSHEFNKLEIKSPKIISMLAAIKLQNLKLKLKTNFVTRIMPNTPVKFSKGVSLVTHAIEVDDSQKEFTRLFLEKSSKVFELNEDELEKATVLSGSGPAYFYLFTKFLSEGMQELGLSEKLSSELAKHTLFGASTLVENETDKTLQEMIDAVTSKGGVTIEAVNRFKEEGLKEICLKSLQSADLRSQNLSKELS